MERKEKGKTNLLHYRILTFSNELIFGLDNGLKEFQVLDVTTMCFYTINKMLNNFVVDFITEGIVVFEYTTNSFSFFNLKMYWLFILLFVSKRLK